MLPFMYAVRQKDSAGVLRARESLALFKGVKQPQGALATMDEALKGKIRFLIKSKQITGKRS